MVLNFRQPVYYRVRDARLAACRMWPAATFAILSLTPVECPTMPFPMGVDEYWRLYYRRDMIDRMSDEELAAVICHEVSHQLLDHHSRCEAILGSNPGQRRALTWNIAADMAINPMLRKEGMKLPDGVVFPSGGQWRYPDGMPAEWYFERLVKAEAVEAEKAQKQFEKMQADAKRAARAEAQQQAAGAGGDPGDEDDEADEDQDGGGAGDSEAGDEQADEQAGGGGEPGDEAGDEADGSGAGDGDEDQDGDDGDGAGQSGGQSGEAGDSAGDGDQESGAGQDGSGAGGAGDAQQQGPAKRYEADKLPGGSAADGLERPWEQGPPSDEAPGIDGLEEKMLKRKVAEAIVKSRGSGSGGGELLDWANELIKPRVDRAKMLVRAVSNYVHKTVGRGDYSYRRPSRRSPSPDMPLPSPAMPVPRITFIQDTSGSMSKADIQAGMGAVDSILKDYRLNEVMLIAGGTDIQSANMVRRAAGTELPSGGGTNMGALIRQAAARKPRPQLIICCTDGETPWCENVGVPTIVVLTEKERPSYKVPDWMTVVELAD